MEALPPPLSDDRAATRPTRTRRLQPPCGAAAAAKAPSSEREVPEVSGDVTAKPSRPTTAAPGSLASPPRPLAGSDVSSSGSRNSRSGAGSVPSASEVGKAARSWPRYSPIIRARFCRKDGSSEPAKSSERGSDGTRTPSETGRSRDIRRSSARSSSHRAARCQLAPRSPTCRWYTPARRRVGADARADDGDRDRRRRPHRDRLGLELERRLLDRAAQPHEDAFSPRTLISPLSSAAAGDAARRDVEQRAEPDVIVQSAAASVVPAASHRAVDDGAARSSQSPPAPRQKRTATARVSSAGAARDASERSRR